MTTPQKLETFGILQCNGCKCLYAIEDQQCSNCDHKALNVVKVLSSK